MNIRDLPPGHYVAAHLPGGRTAYVPWDDPAAAAARRLLNSKARDGDLAAVTAWLDAREPAVARQLTLWETAA